MAPDQSLKQQAADEVLTYIQSGMILGLGAGSTAILAVRGLAEKLSRGELMDVKGIPCSRVIEAEARRLGIPLTTLEDHAPGPNGFVIDLTFDGADEGNLILDCGFGPIHDAERLGARLDGRTGIVAHGLLLGLATEVIVAGASGTGHLKRET